MREFLYVCFCVKAFRLQNWTCFLLFHICGPISRRENFPYSELFCSAFSHIWIEYLDTPYLEYGKMRTRISPHKDTFYAVFITMSLTSWITTLRTLQRKYSVVILFIYLLLYFFCETWQSFDFAKVSASTFSAKDKTTIRFC